MGRAFIISIVSLTIVIGLMESRADAASIGGPAAIGWDGKKNSPSMDDFSDHFDVGRRAAELLDLHPTKARELEGYRRSFESRAAELARRQGELEIEADNFGVERPRVDAALARLEALRRSMADFAGEFPEIDAQVEELLVRAENYPWTLPQPVEQAIAGRMDQMDPDYHPEGAPMGYDPFEFLSDVPPAPGDDHPSFAAAAPVASDYSCTFPRNPEHPVDCAGCMFQEKVAGIRAEKAKDRERTFKVERKKTPGAGKGRYNELHRRFKRAHKGPH